MEVVYNYGVMLLLLDRCIPYLARERLVICYLRYKGQAASDYTNEVSKLCKRTGYFYNIKNKQELIPDCYPVDYFSRYPLDKVLIEQLINALKDDDVYQLLSAYPNPNHRSVALSQ